MYKSILVPIDLGQVEQGKTITRLARNLLSSPDGKLTLLNVVPEIPGYVAAEIPENITSKSKQEAHNSLAQISSQCNVDEVSNVVVREGNAYHEILSIASELDVDLIVMASHQPDFTDYLIGSNTARVVRHATCSVFVVRGSEL